jgi:hypothetical protein
MPAKFGGLWLFRLAVTFGLLFWLSDFASLRMSFGNDELAGLESVVDPICKAKWVSGARNDPALSCYMTTKVERLCDPRERTHFRAVLKQYEADRSLYDAALLKYLLLTQKNFQTSPEEDTLKRLDVASKTAAQDVATDNMQKAFSMELLLESEFSELVGNLSRRGFMTKADLGWWPPDYFSGAITKVDESAPQICVHTP